MADCSPFRFAWVPLAFIAAGELLALYCFQFRLFKHGNKWYSGGTASTEYWGFVRADYSASGGAKPVTAWSFVSVVGVQLGVLLATFAQRWTHDLGSLVSRVEEVWTGGAPCVPMPGLTNTHAAIDMCRHANESAWHTQHLRVRTVCVVLACSLAGLLA